MAGSAALDPKYEFLFSLGAPTVGNLNAAAGNPSLTVAAVHFFERGIGRHAAGGAKRDE